MHGRQHCITQRLELGVWCRGEPDTVHGRELDTVHGKEPDTTHGQERDGTRLTHAALTARGAQLIPPPCSQRRHQRTQPATGRHLTLTPPWMPAAMIGTHGRGHDRARLTHDALTAQGARPVPPPRPQQQRQRTRPATGRRSTGVNGTSATPPTTAPEEATSDGTAWSVAAPFPSGWSSACGAGESRTQHTAESQR